MNDPNAGIAVVNVRSSDGSVSIVGSGGDVDIRTGGAVVTPFRAVPLPTANTNSAVPVDLLVVPGGVTVGKDGLVLLDFDASIELTPPGSSTFQGVELRYLWDGAPLDDVPGGTQAGAFYEVDPQAPAAFDTYSFGLRLRALVQTTAGNHTLSVQWNTLDAAATLNAFAGNGLLTIEGK
jgi:hypothetical protein